MAGVNGAKPRSTSTLDWPKCADAFADRHIKGLARWRGYCDEFVNWLKENRLILIAEQVDKVNPDLVVRGEDGKVTTVRYEAVNAMLLNEFLKEHRRVEEQGVTIAQQKKDFAS